MLVSNNIANAAYKSYMRIKVNNSVYSREAITSTLYCFSGDYFVSQSIDDADPKQTIIEIIAKEVDEPQELEKVFLNALNDFQVRCDIEKRFGYIRDQIVEEAFKPITKRHD